MTTKTITTCDGCRQEMGDGFKWELSPGTFRIVGHYHFHDLKCVSEFATRELAKPKVVSIRPASDFRMLGHNPLEEPKK